MTKSFRDVLFIKVLILINMSCCTGINEKEPCGLPPGTIRSTISVFTVVITFTVLSFLTIYFAINKEYSNSLGVAGILGGGVSTIIGYYFGSRGKQEMHQEVESEVQKEVNNMRYIKDV